MTGGKLLDQLRELTPEQLKHEIMLGDSEDEDIFSPSGEKIKILKLKLSEFDDKDKEIYICIPAEEE